MEKFGKYPRKIIIIVVFAFSILLAMTACKPKQIVLERTDTVRAVSYVRDTLRIETLRTEYKERYDSVAPVLDSAGRVVAYDRWHWRNTSSADVREMERLREVADSLRQSKAVVKTVPVTIEKRVEVNVLKWWQRVLMILGALSLLIFILWAYRRVYSRKDAEAQRG